MTTEKFLMFLNTAICGVASVDNWRGEYSYFIFCGGTLILRYYRSPPHGHVKKCVAIIEQKILEILGIVTLSFDIHIEKVPFSTSKAHGEIKIIIETSIKTECIAPIAYNFTYQVTNLLWKFRRTKELKNSERY